MDATERFAAAVAAPAGEMRLDVAALCLAAHAHPHLDIDLQCARLDDLAQRCPTPTFDGMRAYLFETLGFRGNTRDYGDPENSFLDSVLERRVGIPISLAVVMIEVGRRIGVPVHGVGMPGHFLVMDAARDGVWCDPFHGGALYDLEGCRRLFAQVHGNARGFSRALLVPTEPHAIVARMLANLEGGRLASDPIALRWLCELHMTLPGLSPDQRERLSTTRRAVQARWN
ncbi:MAG TPA: transglutaminase-like domain-containing protein [Acidimicrobiia bacterium]|nr:transglutaminase-like domain-containing protein [Acidimicrobiia bacterium]